MTDNAAVKPTTRISKVWVLPIIALLIGAWMVYYQWQNQGPLITIDMSSASGIEVNKTPIKIRDLDVGQVKKIELKPELDGVTVTARLEKSAARLLNENTRFWVVAPRVSFSEVSGLNTLLSGSFIAMTAETGQTEKDHFTALERPPVTPPGTPGLHVELRSDSDDLTYKPGDTIIYKGFKVGEFEEVHFDVEQGRITYRAFIHAPYHNLIDENTRFWNVSGVKLQLASNGLTIQTGSLETLLANGVTFGNPQGDTKGKPIDNNAKFVIYGDYNAAADERFRYAAQYVLLIDESVRGLTVGEQGRITYRAFIHAPYHNLIDENTRFWNVSGVKLQLASNGLTIQTGSLETLLANGVTFGNPQGDTKGKPIDNNAKFVIYGDYNAAAYHYL